MRLYHATSRRAAAAIIADGFRETIDPLTRRSGVWFADRWVDYGAHWEAAVTIEIPEADLTSYALGFTVPAEDFRAFLMPAVVANRYPRQVLSEATPDDGPQRQGWRRASGPALKVPHD